VSAPNNTLKATRDVGPISRTPILIQRKDELQIRPSVMKTIQCFVFKLLLVQVLKQKIEVRKGLTVFVFRFFPAAFDLLELRQLSQFKTRGKAKETLFEVLLLSAVICGRR